VADVVVAEAAAEELDCGGDGARSPRVILQVRMSKPRKTPSHRNSIMLPSAITLIKKNSKFALD